MRFYSLISSLILSVFLLFISGSESMKTLKHLTVRRGGSLTVPCLYEEEYKSNHKYWCKGEHWISCDIVAYANSSTTGISVTDHSSQNMFTVDLKNLSDSDSGWYWCAVEIGGYWTPDDGDSVYLTVSSDPAVWVENSTVIGQEGSGVSVQGFYSSGYKNEVRKWCRVKTWSCWSVGRTNTSQSSAVIITDYSQGSSRVEMIGLQESDAGWYWFSAGDVGVTVHLTVTERPTTTTAAVTTVPTTQKTTTSSPTSATTKETTTTMTTNLTTNAPSANTKKTSDDNDNSMLIWVLLAVGLGLLFLLIIIITFRTRKRKGNQMEARDPAVPMSSAIEDLQSSCPVYSSVVHKKKRQPSSEAASANDVVYSTVSHQKKPSSEPASANDVVHSTVAKAAKNKRVPPAVEDGEVIYSSVILK
ncbi:CMRF35-like molecule 3 [Astyanax mexicanus]|uniref:CMRF35-like molecule 3 n=1 Tax=Astyanax mexicanus TaxID=7994 RepID=A0A8T2M6I3_ASTMX|nr:CMRF35-like molecule 3 [Astyanax mexicanus]